MHWFEGGKVTKKELKPFQIYEFLNKGNARQFMNSLILFLRHTGHQGLILLMDEMETVVSMSTTIRNAAYENVRLFIDNSETARYLHLFFSIIPDVLMSEKGFKSYDALWSRVRSIGDANVSTIGACWWTFTRPRSRPKNCWIWAGPCGPCTVPPFAGIPKRWSQTA